MGNLPFQRRYKPSGVDKLDEQTSLSSSSSSNSIPRQYVLPVSLCLGSYVDVGKALKKNASTRSAQSMIPKKIIVDGKFLNTMMDFPSPHHKRSLRRVLRKGCLEILLMGASGTAPRRVYMEEVNFVLERLQQDMVETLHMENLSIQSANTRAGKATQFFNLQKLGNLQRIVVQQARFEDQPLVDILAVLGSLPFLREVTLNLLDLEEEQIHAVEATLARLLRSSSTLESISLPHYPTSDNFWNAVEASRSLTYLGLPCHETISRDLSRLQRLLSKETHLEQLDLRCIHPETSFEQLALGLQHNTILQSLNLVLQEDRSAAGIWKCMIPLLKNDNFTLTQLDVFLETTKQSHNFRIACPTLDFYLQQNRSSPVMSGRFHLLRENPSTEEWTEHMVQAARAGDLSTLYYWLRVQPNLVPPH